MDEQGILYRYLPTELEPPQEMWNRLVKVLDDDQPNSFEKMDALEILPPTSAWENIAFALDEHDIPKKNLSFVDIFSAAEITPPPFIWEKIETSLDVPQPLARSIGDKQNNTKRTAIGLAIAACITSIVFLAIDKFDNQPVKPNNTQVAIEGKTNIPKQSNPSTPINSDSPKKQAVVATNNTQSFTDDSIPTSDNTEIGERASSLEKYKPITVPIINTTNGKVANNTGKLKDAFGNVIDRIGDYNTNSGYLAAIGPNGNSVNVSMKLANMIEFFKEDSVAIKNEEYLDKVMRESNIWRQKLIDWRNKVDAADADASKMNFLDPIDLIRFFEKNK